MNPDLIKLPTKPHGNRIGKETKPNKRTRHPPGHLKNQMPTILQLLERGLTNRQIARRLKTTEGALRMRLSRYRRGQ